MRAARPFLRDDRGHDGNAAAYNQLFDGCRSCFHNDSSGTGRSEGSGQGGGGGVWNVVRIIEGERWGRERSHRSEKDL